MRVTSNKSVSGRISGVFQRAGLGVDVAGVAAFSVPLGIAATLSASPGPWLALVLTSTLLRFATIVRPLYAIQNDAVETAADGAVLTLALLFGGHIGLFALAAAALMAHRATACGAGIVAAAAFAAAALSLSNGGSGAPLIEPGLLDSLGCLAVLLRALCLAAAGRPAASGVLDAHALAALNHELRTPLNAIIGFAGLLRALKDDARLAGRCSDYARIIETSGTHMLSVLEAEIGGPKAPAAQPAALSDVDALIAETIELTAPHASRHAVSVRHFKRSGPAQTAGDPRLIRQILLNLTTNAIKFSPHGAEVGISVTRRDGGRIAVSVADHGMGLSGSDLMAIGTPYWRGRNALAGGIQGTGLGLSICRQLAQELGGSLELESRAGSGTIARFVLPRTAPARQRPRLARSTTSPAHSGARVNPVLAIGAR